MKKCVKCDNNIPATILVEGKRRNLKNRRYCFECSPFGKHNTSILNTVNILHCVICDDILSGNKKLYCSNKCKRSSSKYNKHNDYYYQKFRGYERKLELIKLFDSKCLNCGYNKNLAALEFHHIDDRTKRFQLNNRNISSRPFEDSILESKKCILLCANCHREHHYPQNTIEEIESYIKSKNIIKDATQL